MKSLIDLARSLTIPRCPSCGRPMELERESPLGTRAAVFELIYACVPCGERTQRVKSYELE